MKASGLSVTKSQLEVPRACVTAGHPLGARVGAEILRRGGNAVDAAVATAFAMAVVEPFMSCLAGGGSMLIHRARTGASIALDFNVEAPRRAHARMYRLGPGRAGDLFPWRAVEGDANVHGHLAVAVPGSVAGLALALERWGTLDLRDAVAPAARLARRGVPMSRKWHGRVVDVKLDVPIGTMTQPPIVGIDAATYTTGATFEKLSPYPETEARAYSPLANAWVVAVEPIPNDTGVAWPWRAAISAAVNGQIYNRANVLLPTRGGEAQLKIPIPSDVRKAKVVMLRGGVPHGPEQTVSLD